MTRNRGMIALAGAGAIANVVVLGVVLFPPSHTATLAYRGGTVEVPVPTWSICLSQAPGRARYLALGDPVFGPRAGDFGDHDQLGSGHSFFRGDGVRLDITTQKRTRFLTELSLSLSP